MLIRIFHKLLKCVAKMPYATRYQVLFDNNSKGFYYSGDFIEGTAIVETCVGKVIRGEIIVSFLILEWLIKFEI